MPLRAGSRQTGRAMGNGHMGRSPCVAGGHDRAASGPGRGVVHAFHAATRAVHRPVRAARRAKRLRVIRPHAGRRNPRSRRIRLTRRARGAGYVHNPNTPFGRPFRRAEPAGAVERCRRGGRGAGRVYRPRPAFVLRRHCAVRVAAAGAPPLVLSPTRSMRACGPSCAVPCAARRRRGDMRMPRRQRPA